VRIRSKTARDLTPLPLFLPVESLFSFLRWLTESRYLCPCHLLPSIFKYACFTPQQPLTDASNRPGERGIGSHTLA
jgi:hypothetical protein